MSRLLKILSMEDLVVCMGGKNKYLHNHEARRLKEKLRNEESGLSDDTISRRLWT